MRLIILLVVYGALNAHKHPGGKETEETLIKLRNRYESHIIFRKVWNIVVKIGAKLMKIDAKYHSLKKVMNIAFIFKKQ